MWRPASVADDDVIARMCQALDAEDPGPAPIPEAHARRTLAALRAQPWRGCAVVLELGGRAAGYALLVSVWSNELGGEVCVIDEMYVDPAARGQGHGTRLVRALASGEVPWAGQAVALALEVIPGNERARRLYERLGFESRNLSMALRRPSADVER